jgi:prophage DNA circulation protein
MDLDVLAISDEGGIRVVEHVEHGRDGSELERGGAKPMRSSAQLVFFDRPAAVGEVVREDHLARLQRFLRLAAAGVAEFIHPIFGPYQATIETFRTSSSADARNVVTLEAAIWRDNGEGDAAAAAALQLSLFGAPAAATSYAARVDELLVSMTDGDLDAELEAIVGDLSSSGVTERTTDAVERWQGDPTITGTQIAAEADALSAELAAAGDALEAADVLEALDLVVAINLLADSLRTVVDELLATRPQTVVDVVPVTLPLLSYLHARLGPAFSLELADQVIAGNRIDDPLLLTAGTTLARPSANNRRRQ